MNKEINMSTTTSSSIILGYDNGKETHFDLNSNESHLLIVGKKTSLNKVKEDIYQKIGELGNVEIFTIDHSRKKGSLHLKTSLEETNKLFIELEKKDTSEEEVSTKVNTVLIINQLNDVTPIRTNAGDLPTTPEEKKIERLKNKNLTILNKLTNKNSKHGVKVIILSSEPEKYLTKTTLNNNIKNLIILAGTTKTVTNFLLGTTNKNFKIENEAVLKTKTGILDISFTPPKEDAPQTQLEETLTEEVKSDELTSTSTKEKTTIETTPPEEDTLEENKEPENVEKVNDPKTVKDDTGNEANNTENVDSERKIEPRTVTSDKKFNIIAAIAAGLLFVLLVFAALAGKVSPSESDSHPPSSTPTESENITVDPTPPTTETDIETESVAHTDGTWEENLSNNLKNINVIAVNNGEIIINPTVTNYDKVIEVYTDYGCSYCREFEKQLEASSYIKDPNTLLVFHLVGILDTQESQFSTYSAAFSSNVAENSPEHWVKLHNEIFKLETVTGEEDIVNLLKNVGVTDEEILSNPAQLDEKSVIATTVNNYSIDVSEKNVITGTPTVFLNGEKQENGFVIFE